MATATSAIPRSESVGEGRGGSAALSRTQKGKNHFRAHLHSLAAAALPPPPPPLCHSHSAGAVPRPPGASGVSHAVAPTPPRGDSLEPQPARAARVTRAARPERRQPAFGVGLFAPRRSGADPPLSGVRKRDRLSVGQRLERLLDAPPQQQRNRRAHREAAEGEEDARVDCVPEALERRQRASGLHRQKPAHKAASGGRRALACVRACAAGGARLGGGAGADVMGARPQVAAATCGTIGRRISGAARFCRARHSGARSHVGVVSVKWLDCCALRSARGGAGRGGTMKKLGVMGNMRITARDVSS
jgi:hypothetical protein